MFSKSNEIGRVWLVFVAIASTLMAVVLLGQQVTGRTDSPESDTSANVISFAFNIRPGYQGIAVIDRENYTICLYEYNQSRAAHERFALLSVRNFRYDQMLEDYNNSQPRPDEIKERVMRLRRAVEDGAAVDVAKKASLAEEN